MKVMGMRLCNKGVTLIELLVALGVFSVVMAMVYSVYNTLLKHTMVERKVAKTELDVVNVIWPLTKEIQTAGFGVSSSVVPITWDDTTDELIINSTAAGDSKHAGKWSYIGASCAVTGLPDTAPDNTVAVINILDKSLLAQSPTVSVVTVSGSSFITPCDSSYEDNIAYWIPDTTTPYYQARYSLEPYVAPGDPKPTICAINTKLSRSSRASTSATLYRPLIDCVLHFEVKFGCIDSSGGLTWRNDRFCGTATLSLIKIGIIVQNSPRRDMMVSPTITLFEDLLDASGSSLKRDVPLSEEERHYKWREIEQTITLRNQE